MMFGIECEPIDGDSARVAQIERLEQEARLASRLLGMPVAVALRD